MGTEYLDEITVTADSNSYTGWDSDIKRGSDGRDSDSYDTNRSRRKIKFKELTLSTRDTFQFWTLSKGDRTYIAYLVKGKKYLLAEVREGKTIIFDSRDNNGIIVGGYDSKTGERYIFIGFDVADDVFLKNDNPGTVARTMTAQELLNANNGNLDSLKGSFRVVEELSKTVKNTPSNNQNTDSIGKIKDTISISENVLKGIIEDDNKYREALQKAGRLSEAEALKTATEIKNIFSTRLGLIGKTLTYSEFVDDLKKGYVEGDWSKLESFTRNALEELVGFKAAQIISKLVVIIFNLSPAPRAFKIASVLLSTATGYFSDKFNISELLTDKSLFNKYGELYALTKDHYLSASGDINLPEYIRNAQLSGNRNSTITGNNGDNILKGNSGNNILYGNNGNDTLFGDLGNDKLFGGKGNDILEGGKGDDYLEGGEGDDIYKFNFNDGNDTIIDSKGSDKIILGKGIELEKTYFKLENNKLTLSFIDTNASVSIDRGYKKRRLSKKYDYFNKSINISFHSGHYLNYDDILDIIKNNQVKNIVKYELYDKKVLSSSESTTLIGDIGKDFLQGNSKNNHLEGKSGSDVYYFSGAIGNDTIYDEAGNDKIYFDESFYGRDILFAKVNMDLRISFSQSNESILIKEFDKMTTRWRGGFKRRYETRKFNKIENLQIGNDVIVDLAKLVDEMSSFAVNVTEGKLRVADTLENLHNPNYQSILS
ncbi:calcium-binding protein [Rodentibacter pneumotropicus]|uniref:calcium-binding protein n=1 Tax=Rodentibacter pneumotropicus TaxID=758 RepID=UPI00109D286E|nr:calcium-binding protein [Rodentibacter pneumotropicus]THA09928.1 calcium-binding protein [Rodentibacter pneumotropicus]